MIEFVNVSKSFGDFKAVLPMNLKIEPGEIFGFLGPNGAGKTTSIKMLTGILPPSTGEIFIQDLSMTKNPVQCKRITGYVPDRPYVYEKLKGFEFLDFITQLYSLNSEKTQKRALELLDLFDMTQAASRIIEDYSHGMKQKLVIIASLLHDPSVYVIDEPMVGLDPKGTKTIKDLFKNLSRSGKTIFLSTHTMSVAQEICDRIAIIHKGQILATGTIATLQDMAKSNENLEGLFLKITEESITENKENATKNLFS